MEKKMLRKLSYIGRQAGARIQRLYPFKNSQTAAEAFINFEPRKYHGIYHDFRMDCMEIFLRAYICSILEKHPRISLRTMVRFVRNTPLVEVFDSLHNGELCLSASDRDCLLEIIENATEEFMIDLQGVSAVREDAKMIFIAVILRRSQLNPFSLQ